MKSLKMIATQLKRIADSLMLIEITLLKINNLQYPDVREYAENYNEESELINKKFTTEESTDTHNEVK